MTTSEHETDDDGDDMCVCVWVLSVRHELNVSLWMPGTGNYNYLHYLHSYYLPAGGLTWRWIQNLF